MVNNAKKVKGEIGESMILAELISKGMFVSIPFGENQRYDMIIDNGTRLFKVQCKTAWFKKNKKDVLIFQTTSCWKGGRQNYIDEIDLFAVYSEETKKVYIIFIDEAPSGGDMKLRLLETKNNQSKNVNWAYDYELDKRIKDLGL